MPKETTPSVAEQADERAAFEATIGKDRILARCGDAYVSEYVENDWYVWQEARATLAASQAASHSAPEPVGWVSPEQLAAHPDGSSDASGRYLPVRKTPAGKFTMPIYAAPLGAESKACASVGVEPDVPVGYKAVLVPDEAAPAEPDWEECIRQAEVSTGLKVERHTFSIIKREIRRWIAHAASPAPSVGEPVTYREIQDSTLPGRKLRIAPSVSTEITIPRIPTEAMLMAFYECPPEELQLAWEAMLQAAETMSHRATPPVAPAVTEGASHRVRELEEEIRAIEHSVMSIGVERSTIRDACRRILAAPAAAVPEKWIDDPHDIDQGQMLNPEWLRFHGITAQQAHAQQQTPQSVAAAVPESPAAAESWQAVDDPTLERAEKLILGTEGNANVWMRFLPSDSSQLAAIALHCIREVRASRAPAATEAPSEPELRAAFEAWAAEEWGGKTPPHNAWLGFKGHASLNRAVGASDAAALNPITASVMRDDGGEQPAFCLMAAFRTEQEATAALAAISTAPAAPAVGASPSPLDRQIARAQDAMRSWSPEKRASMQLQGPNDDAPIAVAKTWAAYLAGMIETYLNFDTPKEGREAAIAGVIERRMWSGPAVGASVQPVPGSAPSFAMLKSLQTLRKKHIELFDAEERKLLEDVFWALSVQPVQASLSDEQIVRSLVSSRSERQQRIAIKDMASGGEMVVTLEDLRAIAALTSSTPTTGDAS